MPGLDTEYIVEDGEGKDVEGDVTNGNGDISETGGWGWDMCVKEFGNPKPSASKLGNSSCFMPKLLELGVLIGNLLSLLLIALLQLGHWKLEVLGASAAGDVSWLNSGMCGVPLLLSSL